MDVLLIEDDEVDARTVQRVFRTHGGAHALKVFSAAGPALDYLWRRGEAQGGPARRPGLILLDLNMPGMSGLEFLTVLRSDPELRRIPVIILSTSGLESDIQASYRAGVAGYFVKPLEYGEFTGVVRSILRYWEQCRFPQAGPEAAP